MKNITVCSPRQAKKFIISTIEAGLVPIVLSDPGQGKSSIVRSIAEQFNLKLIDHRVATSDPVDYNGMPIVIKGEAQFIPFNEIFPTEDTSIPEGYEGWLLFLDEITNANRSLQAACYKLVLDRMVGQKKLHPNVVIVAAGTHVSSHAAAVDMSTAMQSRLVHFHMESTYDDWLEDVAIPNKYDPRIIAYLSHYPYELNNFKADHTDLTFACNRTWEFVNKLINGKNLEDDDVLLLSGTIGSGVAVKFLQYTKIFDKLPTLESVLSNPDTLAIPDEISIQWSSATSLAFQVNEQNISKLITYINRMNNSQRILFYKLAASVDKSIWKNPSFSKGLIEIGTYLHS